MESKRTADNESPRFGYWFVAYLDLMGIRRALAKTDFLPVEDPTRVEELTASLKASVGAIRNLRSFLAKYFDGLALAAADDRVFDGLPPDKVELAKRLQGTRIRRDHIADGLVVSCPLGAEVGHFPIRAVWEVIGACAAMMLVQLAVRRPVRGGLEVGTAIEVDGELFGAAFVNAYEIESKRAKYPRLVVGAGLLRYLQQLSRSAGGEIEDRFKRQMAQGCAGLLKKDFDGEWIVDYAGPRAHEFFLKGSVDPGLVQAARTFARDAREEWQPRTEGDGPKIFDKYCQLVRYLDANAP